LINLVIVDDEALIRDGITMRLADATDINIMGTASCGREAVLLCSRLKPDIVLMDIRMPGMDGLEAAKEIKEDNGKIKIIILTTFADQNYLHKAMEYSCNGYITKDAELEDFISIIRSVYRGYDVWSGKLEYKQGKVTIKENNMDLENLSKLSEREIEIIKFVITGLKLSEIARRLNYSEGYIRQVISKINEKLGVKNSRELAVWGARHGL
jgi:DNA-binding NarL/FixJ family response regulator